MVCLICFNLLGNSLICVKGVVEQESMKNLMFGTYFDQDSDEDKRYEEVVNAEAFKNLSQNCLDEYNATHKTKMDIILFDYALEHLSKICRVLSMQCGSALLVPQPPFESTKV